MINATLNENRDPSIDVSFLPDELPAGFNDRVAEALQVPVDERIQHLETLLMSTMVEDPDGGEQPMLYAVWDAAQSARVEAEELAKMTPEERRELATPQPRGERTVVRVNPDGELSGVFHAGEQPVDVRMQRRAMKTAKNQAWGRPQNRAAGGHNGTLSTNIPIIPKHK